MSAGKGLVWLINKLWLSLAIILVLAAVLMSALRYALPHIPDVSRQLEIQLTQRLNQPVEIDQLAMSWHREGPALDVSGITLTSHEDAPVQFRVEQISVVLDFWQSLAQLQLVAQEFILRQAVINIDLRQLQQSQAQVNLTRFENLFLQQLERFSLTQGQLNVTNLAGNQRSLVIEKLSWLNQGNRHQGVGQFRVKDFTRNSLDFILQLEGNQLSSVDGQIYIDSRQVDISPWLEQQLTGVDITESNVNFTSWLTLVDGDISSGLLQLRDNRVSAQVGEQDIALHIPHGTVAIEPRQKGWLLNVKPMTLELNQQPIKLPLISWLSEPNVHQLSVKQLPVHEFARALAVDSPLLEGLSAPVDIWAQRDAQGDIYWHAESEAVKKSSDNVQLNFSPLTLSLSGKNKAYGTWSLTGQEWHIASPELGAEPWQFDVVQFAGDWHRDGAGWRASTRANQVVFNDLALTLDAVLKNLFAGQPDRAADIELHAYSTQPFSVKTARQMLPSVMGEGVKRYLTEALNTGTINGLEVLWRGDVNRFPDADMAGLFNARIDFATLDYRFQPDWPSLKNTPLRLDFYQSGLTMYSDGGHIEAVALDSVTAKIPDLADASTGLALQSAVSGPANSLSAVFEKSPLTSVAETLRQVQPRSPISGEFSLDIPFDGSRDVDVSVKTNLQQQQFYIAATDQTFMGRSGVLTIHNDEVRTENLVVDWYGRPITTKIFGQMREGEYQLTVDTAIDWQVEPLLNALPTQGWQKYFYGAINGSGTLALTFADGVAVNWQSRYDLTGLESNLPAPLAKEFGENWQLTLSLSGNQEQLSLNADIGERLSWRSRWQPGSDQWQSAQLVLGSRPAKHKAQLAQRSDAVVVSAQLPHVNVGEWYDLIYFLQQESGDQASAAGLSFTPDYIVVNTPNLHWAGQSFVDAEFEIWPDEQQWFGRVYANDLSMEVMIPKNFIEQPIVVDADFIQLSSTLGDMAPSNVREQEEQWQWVKRVPAIDITCQTCKLDDKNFVDLTAELRPIAGGIALSSLTTRSNNSELEASGFWLVEEGQPVTQVSGQLSSEDFGDLLRQYGLETAIRDSSVALSFGLKWQGHPHAIDFSSLGGAMQWQLGQGYLAEVSDGGARIFSLLSLDSILRKLTLDFRDIFSQGMFYTDLDGSVQIANGVAKTTDTRLLGSAGNMDITGTTNLVTGELDYLLTYAPKVTSSLPVILAWMVNPPSGLAALLIDKVLQEAEVISQLRYHVTGTIDNPKVTEIERDSRPVEIPALEDTKQEVPNATSTDSRANVEPQTPTGKPANG